MLQRRVATAQVTQQGFVLIMIRSLYVASGGLVLWFRMREIRGSTVRVNIPAASTNGRLGLCVMNDPGRLRPELLYSPRIAARVAHRALKRTVTVKP